jgi:hypothetical protein
MIFTHKNPNIYKKKYLIQNDFETDKRTKLKDLQFINSLKIKKMPELKIENKKPLLRQNYSIEYIKNTKNIKTITNVYQSKYSNNTINSSGLGDFLRGCYFLLEFCEKYNFESKIIFNNCISNFLLSDSDCEKNKTILSRINLFKNLNYTSSVIQNNTILYPNLSLHNIVTDFIDYLSKTNVYNNNSFIYCNSYPLNENVSEKSKEIIRSILKPNDTVLFSVQECLNQLELECKNYSVFHIRSGDKYLNNNFKQFPVSYFEELKKNIQSYIANNETYLLIADNNEIKILLKQYFPNIKIILKKITHFGEGVVLEEEKVKNTLIDFYMLSFSKNIICFSFYEHGSGFSYWCAKTYNIPYVVKLIK